MKKIFSVLILSLAFTAASFAQQITKFAVVDTNKVYQAYFRNSAPVRNYETKKEDFQKELDKHVAELQRLNDQKIEYQRKGNDSDAMKIEAQITKKTDFINEYTSAKNTELESLKKSLKENNAFYKQLYDTLARVAESGGYSAILNLQEANSILWYSPSVDITDQVISQLGL
ncbi:OmpH family outer membrane protein [Treponema sp.]|uniref:OmpH family outer membrane protein n=1 Tax=Treponema sp. TaxID=166 RepID=UPI00298EB3D7|nr:OmpH family outer membrane protein [Treponema sp.]MCQ2241324.1 OmpH family outer membrane protein [Treponema sp.]